MQPALFSLIFQPKNIGAVANQWQVFDACTGNYIAMVEGDDFWTFPHKLQKQIDYLDEHHNCSICFHNALIIDENGEQIGYSNLHEQPIDSGFKELAKGEFIYTATCVFRSIYLKQFPTDGRPYMNNYTLDLFNAQFGSIHYFNEVWSVYRKHSGGAWSMKPRLYTLLAQLPTYEYYLKLFGHANSPYFLQHVRNIAIELLQLSEMGENRAAKKVALKTYIKYHGGWRRNKRLLVRLFT
jgi:hypothetical protein